MSNFVQFNGSFAGVGQPVPNNPFSPLQPPAGNGVQFPPNYTSPGPFVTQGGPPQGPVPSPTSTNVYQQIEATADYYEPAIYELLSFYSSMVPQPDELDGQFVPLTDVQPAYAGNTLIFAVGILPPSSNVTGRLLDRSATIANTMPLTSGVNVNPTAGGVAGGNIPPGQNKVSANGIAFIAAHEGFVGHPYYATPAEQAQNIQSIGYGHVIQPGQENLLNGLTPDQGQQLLAQDAGWAQAEVNKYVTVPLTQNQNDACVSYVFSTGNIRNAPFLGALNSGNYTQAAQMWPTSSVRGVDGNIVPSLQAVRANETNLFSTPDGSTYTYQGFNAKVNIPSTSGVINGDGTQPSNGWQGTGSKNASQAQQNINTFANNNLNSSNLGQAFLNAQVNMINATLQAIQTMKNTPPLQMLVNPQSFKLSAEKIVSDGEWGRNGPIVEHWGEQLDKLECSGKVAAFYSIDASGGSSTSASPGNFGYSTQQTFAGGAAGGGPGITRIARQYSAAYQNFLSLWLLYKNNGGIFLNPAQLTPSVPGNTSSPLSAQPTNLSVLGSIYIYYDNILYLGSFDSFNLTESETAPYTLEYNFTFTVRATFLLDMPMDQNGVPSDYSAQLAQLQASQSNPLQGLPAPNQIGVTPGALALQSQNAQPAGSVGPPPGLTPQQYASIGQGAPAVTTSSFRR